MFIRNYRPHRTGTFLWKYLWKMQDLKDLSVMKKYILITAVLFIFFFTFFSMQKKTGQPSADSAMNSSSGANTPQSAVPEPDNNSGNKITVGMPTRLQIPKIGVDASIESVGLDNEDKMDVPKNPWDVAWYNLGAKPGETGNAVIDGHLDTQTSTAVFWNLGNVIPGDTMTVTDDKGNSFTFTVTAKQTYPYDQLPMNDIFGSSSKARLNLITCGGLFDRQARNYSNRVVVFSELKS